MNPSPRRLVSLSLAAAAFAFSPAARADDSVASQRSVDLQQTIRTLQDTTDASGLAQLGDATCALADSEICRVAAHGGGDEGARWDPDDRQRCAVTARGDVDALSTDTLRAVRDTLRSLRRR